MTIPIERQAVRMNRVENAEDLMMVFFVHWRTFPSLLHFMHDSSKNSSGDLHNYCELPGTKIN